MTAARQNLTVALLDAGGGTLIRCCDDVRPDELRAAGIAPGEAVMHPFKGARGMCEGGAAGGS